MPAGCSLARWTAPGSRDGRQPFLPDRRTGAQAPEAARLAVPMTQQADFRQAGIRHHAAKERMLLDETERDWIARALRQGGIEPTRDQVARLADLIAASLTECGLARARPDSFRKRHDALRTVWLLAERKDPPIGQIRHRIRGLPPELVVELDRRAHELWPRVFRSDPPAAGFAAWAQSAAAPALLEAVRTFVADGGTMVAGHKRPRGKRSRAHFEPRVLGRVRGKHKPPPNAGPQAHKAVATPDPFNGRPAEAAEDALVMHLAVDWLMVTGKGPESGRNDRTGFGSLVRHVFGWLDRDAEQSLRRYWDELASAIVTPVAGGWELR
jgi:hypothetical protein